METNLGIIQLDWFTALLKHGLTKDRDFEATSTQLEAHDTRSTSGESAHDTEYTLSLSADSADERDLLTDDDVEEWMTAKIAEHGSNIPSGVSRFLGDHTYTKQLLGDHIYAKQPESP